jgi:hypothetical protein
MAAVLRVGSRIAAQDDFMGTTIACLMLFGRAGD